MTPERPPSRSERLLRSTLQRSPPTHQRRHSHVPPSTSSIDEDDDQLWRAALIHRTPATNPHYQQSSSHSSSPTRDYYSHHSPSRSRAASPSLCNRASSPSPRSSRRQSLQRSPTSVDDYYGSFLQRHNSTPARKRSAPTSASVATIESQLTPHEQVLRARLERVLIAGRVVDERERSRERHHHHHQRRGSRDGWPWSDLASTPPKSTSSSDYGHNPTHHRSRSKTDPLTSPPLPTIHHHPRRATASDTVALSTTPAPSSPYLIPHTKISSSVPMPIRQQYYRNNSGSSTSTPPLTADASPILSQPHSHSLPEDRLLLTPPPTPPFYGNQNTATAGPSSTVTATPAGSTRPLVYRSHTRGSTDSAVGPPYVYTRDMDDSVEQLALPLPLSQHTFNARKASERCRMMEGYVSFAQVEGLGTPPDGVDDDENRGILDGSDSKRREEGKRGRGLIGMWARKLFVGVQS